MLLLIERTLTACRLHGREAVVCAFSGGPDSTALLLELVRLRDAGSLGPLYAGHFEHGIRGQEALDDLAFCRPPTLRHTACLRRRRPGSCGTASFGG